MLLPQYRRGEKQQTGKLKIFFACVRGWQNLLLLKRPIRNLKGNDIVIGYIETHNRLAKLWSDGGFEIIPRISLNTICLIRGIILRYNRRKPKIELLTSSTHKCTPKPAISDSRMYSRYWKTGYVYTTSMYSTLRAA